MGYTIPSLNKWSKIMEFSGFNAIFTVGMIIAIMTTLGVMGWGIWFHIFKPWIEQRK
jgi:hypothetical protein